MCKYSPRACIRGCQRGGAVFVPYRAPIVVAHRGRGQRAYFAAGIPRTHSRRTRERQAAQAAQILGRMVHEKFPFHGATQPIADDLTQLVLNRAWRPTLSVTGADGLPPLKSAGNVLRPHTDLKLSLRLPPTVDAPAAPPRSSKSWNATRHMARRLNSRSSKPPPVGAPHHSHRG